MKHIILSFLAIVAGVLCACSDDDNWNSTHVTIGFTESKYDVRESDDIIQIPFQITGERDGDISIQVKATDNTAIANAHYIVTSNIIRVPENADSDEIFFVEVRIIDDGDEENDNRSFSLDIVKLEGATTNEISHCDINIKDVDKNPYFKLLGSYNAYLYDMETNEEVKMDVELSYKDNNHDYTEQYLVAMGMFVFNSFDKGCPWFLTYRADGTLKFENESSINYGFYQKSDFIGGWTGVTTVSPFHLADEGFELADYVNATYNEDFTEIVFEEGAAIANAVYQYDNERKAINKDAYRGYMDGFKLLKLVKK